jgi:hypothetical protein
MDTNAYLNWLPFCFSQSVLGRFEHGRVIFPGTVIRERRAHNHRSTSKDRLGNKEDSRAGVQNLLTQTHGRKRKNTKTVKLMLLVRYYSSCVWMGLSLKSESGGSRGRTSTIPIKMYLQRSHLGASLWLALVIYPSKHKVPSIDTFAQHSR